MSASDLITLLVVALAVCALYVLANGRFGSNLPLLFYIAAVLLIRASSREVNEYIFGGGAVLALMLRFEFMNGPATKLIAVLECAALLAVGWGLTAQALKF